MLIDFRVSNFRSLRDEQVLTMEADPNLDASDSRLRHLPGNHSAILPLAVIYGSNAGGKSNLLSALAFMREAVLHSNDRWQTFERIPRTAFAWSGSSSLPSLFEVTVLVEATKYQFGFSLDDHTICEEWLFQWKGDQRSMIYEREGSAFDLGVSYLESIRETTSSVSPKSLLLSSAVHNSPVELERVRSWFQHIRLVNVLPQNFAWEDSEADEWLESIPQSSSWRDLPAATLSESDQPDIWRHSLDFLQTVDLGIVDIRQVQQLAPNGSPVRRILVRHSTGDDAWLDLTEESRGTRFLIRLAPSLVQAVETGGLLLVDELESSLHPLIGKSIVKLFSEPRTNPNNAQVIFTTHDTRLLGEALGEPLLRRDQVWFAEKNQEGASVIYPLTDFQSQDLENTERGYLQGRYGAIPWCSEFSWFEE